MSAYLLLVALAAVCISKVNCATNPAGQDEKTEGRFPGLAESLFGFKPCIDETCENFHIYGQSSLKTEDLALEDENAELPRAHCMLLRQSVLDLFKVVETKYPDISSIKYRTLEKLIEYMHHFSSLKLEKCESNMQLIDLIILAANSLKTQYELQGEVECIYSTSGNEIGKPVPYDEVTEVPCDSESDGYTSTVCPGSNMKQKTKTPVVSKPYEQSTTPQISKKPYVPSSTELPIVVEPEKKRCPDGVSTEKPCQKYDTLTEDYYSAGEIEITAEDEKSEPVIPQVGSLRGIPGVHYPNYTDIPITSFTCADKKFIPGFYADLDTGCQVFHVCYEHRRESFLCPVGTIFNQPILACDYWYSSNCSLACDYYDVNEKNEFEEQKIDAEVEELLTLIEETEKPENELPAENELDKISQFFPVKAIVTDVKPEVVVPIEPTISYTEVASEIVDKMATAVTKGISSTRHVIKSIPEPVALEPVLKPVEPDFHKEFIKPMKMNDLLKETVVPLVKAKLAAIPISKATALKTALPVSGLAKAKVSASFAAIPVLAKAKVASTVPVIAKVAAIPAVKAASVPVVKKAKVAAAAPVIVKAKMAVPAVKIAAGAPVIVKGKVAVPAFKVAAAKVAKSSIPVLKAKMAAPSIPLAKAKLLPVVKAKVAKSAGTPLLKAKMLALPLAKSKPLPLAKVKLAKAAAISPLTKKALALGYMKLLKAKKFALMG